jgi:hypothetical protein
MEYITIKKQDGTEKAIFVDHSVYPNQQLTYNELAEYHRVESKKYTNGSRIN